MLTGNASQVTAAIQQIDRYAKDPVAFIEEQIVVTLEPWQKEVLGALATQDRIAIRSGHGVGKALANDEPVLTPQGWRPIATLRPGDTVIAGDGSWTRVLGVYPQGERELYRVTLDDGSSVLADSEHLWHTRTRSERKHGGMGQVRTTAEIAASLTFPNGSRAGLNHQVPTCGAIEAHDLDLPVPPYVLGVWLGDGSKGGRFTQLGNEIGEQLEAAGARLGKRGRKAGTEAVTQTILGLGGPLRGLGLADKRAHEKFIPAIYKLASAAQRHAILQGVLDTDGTVGQNNAVVLDITAPLLADDVAEIVRSLGGIVRRSEKWGSYGGKRCRRVSRLFISMPKAWPPFRMTSKAARYRPSFGHKNRDKSLRRFVMSVEHVGAGEATCITIEHPSQLFVTRDHIVTHNSAMMAWTIIWWLCTHYPAKIACTAPTAHQLYDVLWSEIAIWLRRMAPQWREQLTWKSDKIELAGAANESFAVARTARKEQPEALQGLHSSNLLLIIDEASGVDDLIFEVGEGAMSTKGAKTLMAGNPTRSEGFFYRAFHQNRERWWCRKVSCQESSQATQKYIDDIAASYGVDSNVYRVRVLGEFPSESDDTVIPLHLCEAAIARQMEPTGSTVWGLDVARFGDDRSALAKRRGNVMLEPVKWWNGFDTMQTAGRIALEYNEALYKPDAIFVDVIGLGAGVVDRMGELGLPVVGVNVGETPATKDRFMRLRDELWFSARDWLAARDSKMVDDPGLIAELTMVRYKFLSSGKLQVESKADVKKRTGNRSPDLADAFILTFAQGASRIAMSSYEPAVTWEY